MASIYILAHLRLKRNKTLHKIIRILSVYESELVVKYTEGQGHMSEMAASLPETCHWVFVAGGDGSLHEAVNGLMRLSHRPVLTLIPMGSGNDFARTLNIPSAEKWAIIKRDQWIQRDIDLIYLSCHDVNGQETTRFSVNIADVGIGGEIAQWLHRVPDFLGPGIKYSLAVVLGFIRYRKRRFTIRAEGLEYTGPVLSLCMANGRYFGNGLGISPFSDPSDGMMSLACFGSLTLWDYIRHLKQIRRAEPVADKRVFYYQTTWVEVDSPDSRSPIDMDGELGGYTSLKAKVLPRAIRFAIPPV